MRKKSAKQQNSTEGTEILRDLLILELAKAGVPQLENRKVVGCDVHRVSRIAKVLRKARAQSTE